jgi:ribosomal protein S10
MALAFCVILRARNKTQLNTAQRRLETDEYTDHPGRGIIKPEIGQSDESDLGATQHSRTFETAIPATEIATAAAPQAQAPGPLPHQVLPSDAVPPQVAEAVRQEYERVVHKRTRLQELMRLEEEEEMLMRQLHASSLQSAGPPTELPSTETPQPAELSP